MKLKIKIGFLGLPLFYDVLVLYYDTASMIIRFAGFWLLVAWVWWSTRAYRAGREFWS